MCSGARHMRWLLKRCLLTHARAGMSKGDCCHLHSTHILSLPHTYKHILPFTHIHIRPFLSHRHGLLLFLSGIHLLSLSHTKCLSHQKHTECTPCKITKHAHTEISGYCLCKNVTRSRMQCPAANRRQQSLMCTVALYS